MAIYTAASSSPFLVFGFCLCHLNYTSKMKARGLLFFLKFPKVAEKFSTQASQYDTDRGTPGVWPLYI